MTATDDAEALKNADPPTLPRESQPRAQARGRNTMAGYLARTPGFSPGFIDRSYSVRNATIGSTRVAR